MARPIHGPIIAIHGKPHRTYSVFYGSHALDCDFLWSSNSSVVRKKEMGAILSLSRPQKEHPRMRDIPRFLSAAVPGFKVVDVKEWIIDGRIDVYLEPVSNRPEPTCYRCGEVLMIDRGKHRLKLEGMPILGLRTFFHLWRQKGHCSKCKKARSEALDLVADETPHLMQDYAWWIGRFCEIAAVSRVAELLNLNETSTWRVDFNRMKRMLAHYKIPIVTQISVDEVYARKKPKFEGESRDERFFTVVCDLKTRRVIWVAESRRKEALDQFFLLIGKDQCSKIEVVASDQHEGYAASIQEHCSNATHVLDRFHLMQIFEEAVNDTRKILHQEQPGGSELRRLSRGQYRFMFVKKANRRTDTERQHIDEVLKENAGFAKLELIKERMFSFFDQQDETSAKQFLKKSETGFGSAASNP